ncbi:MAG: hypothetical protein RDV41_07040 [Planctomycetota bacterium]|nr:hypothetical protein [Planctomycetota bacterium]
MEQDQEFVSTANPARTLLAILLKLKETHTETESHAFMAGLLGVNRSAVVNFYSRMLSSFALVGEARAALATLKLDHTKYEFVFDQIATAFLKVAGNRSVGDVRHEFDERTYLALQACADLLEWVEPVMTTDRKTLEELRQKVQALLDEVSESNLSENLKALLLAKLADLRCAIETCEVVGIGGLRRALESSVGWVQLNLHSLAGEAQDEQKKGIIAKVVEFLAHVAQILGYLGGSPLLPPGHLVNSLGSGKH